MSAADLVTHTSNIHILLFDHVVPTATTSPTRRLSWTWWGPYCHRASTSFFTARRYAKTRSKWQWQSLRSQCFTSSATERDDAAKGSASSPGNECYTSSSASWSITWISTTAVELRWYESVIPAPASFKYAPPRTDNDFQCTSTAPTGTTITDSGCLLDELSPYFFTASARSKCSF
jgi:hypothetical protein